MDALSTLAGLLLAVLGAKLLVDGGTAVAKRFGIPSLVIGATVVAFGTSMPELTVNVDATARDFRATLFPSWEIAASTRPLLPDA